MTRLTAHDIAARTGGAVLGDASATVASFGFDSRRLDAGACFVALRGDRDGHDFVTAAFTAGARVALVERGFAAPSALGAGQALVLVDDSLRALQDVARTLRRDRADLHVVAVAGSSGKTSTKDLLAAALASRGCHANAESFNNEFGLPITLCNTPESARVVVTEMGERFAGDLEALCDIAQPDTGVVTNVGLAHAEYLGGREGVVAVLAELVDAIPAAGTAVLNADDPATPRLAAAARAAVVTVGESEGADYRITDVVLDERLRPSFVLAGQRFRVPLHGRHHATNAAMAIAVGNAVFSLSLDELALELETARPGRGRMELLESAAGVTVVNDSYNANPASVEAALVAFAHLPLAPGARRIAVLGDMRELGAHHDAAHRAAGQQAARLGLDLLVGVGEGGAAIAAAAGAAGIDARTAADAPAATAIVTATVRAGDAVLVKASRALGLERVAKALLDAGAPDGARGRDAGVDAGAGRISGGARP